MSLPRTFHEDTRGVGARRAPLPRLGRMIARSEIDAYKYLPDSVARWPQPEELKAMMERATLRDVTFELVFGGVAAIHTGIKP